MMGIFLYLGVVVVAFPYLEMMMGTFLGVMMKFLSYQEML